MSESEPVNRRQAEGGGVKSDAGWRIPGPYASHLDFSILAFTGNSGPFLYRYRQIFSFPLRLFLMWIYIFTVSIKLLPIGLVL